MSVRLSKDCFFENWEFLVIILGEGGIGGFLCGWVVGLSEILFFYLWEEVDEDEEDEEDEMELLLELLFKGCLFPFCNFFYFFLSSFFIFLFQILN